MTTQFRIDQRPQQRELPGAPRVAVAAQRQDYLSAMPAPDAELAGLVKGLSVLNPALSAYANQQQFLKTKEDLDAGAAFGQQVQNPTEALKGGAVATQDMQGLPPAVSDNYITGMRSVLANRAGIEMKNQFKSEYDELVGTEGFDAGRWLQEKRAQSLAGIEDPDSLDQVGKHMTQFEQWVLDDQNRRADEARTRVRTEALSADARDLWADGNPQMAFQNYQGYLARAKAAGFTPAEAAQMALIHAVQASSDANGAPEVFDLFYLKDDQGMSLVDRNPKMAAQVEAAKKQAEVQLDKRLDEENSESNAKTLANIETMIDKEPEKVTQEFLLSNYGKHDAVRTPQQFASLWARAQEAVLKRKGTEQVMGHWDGSLYLLPAGKQQDVMEAKLGTAMLSFDKAVKDGDMQTAGALASRIVQDLSKANPSVAFGQLERFTKLVKATAPSEDGPTPQFMMNVGIYQAMSQHPELRSMYFDTDTSMILDAFVTASQGGQTDSKAAYAQAYRAVSPEGKKAAAERAKTPEFQSHVDKAVKQVTGSSWVPRWLGGNGRPENQEFVQGHLKTFLTDFYSRWPDASEDQARNAAESYVKDNFIMDTTTNMAVKVPPKFRGQATQEAFSEFSKQVVDVLKLDDVPGDWSVRYVPVGDTGSYNVVAFNGARSQVVGSTSLDELTERSRAKKVLSPEERQRIGAARKALSEGSPVDLTDDELAKAVSTGAITEEQARRITQGRARDAASAVQSVPEAAFGKPSLVGVIPPTQKAGMQVDAKLTGKVAMEFNTAPSPDPETRALNLSASLVTMGEAVMLQPYDDPAHGAGKNIGMGYNLQANAKNVHEDLRKAGVPKERIQDVVDGKAALTSEQAKRLLLVSLPRYQEQVRKVAEGTSPGLWNRMTPAQKAVMVDIAYQTGNVAQFKKAWDRLQAGDNEGFLREAKVTYVNRNGERVEDTRRNTLRANMMAGAGVWESTVTRAMGSSKPTMVAQAN